MICDGDDVIFCGEVIDKLLDFVDESSASALFDHESVHGRFLAKVIDGLCHCLPPQPNEFDTVLKSQHSTGLQRREFSQGMAQGVRHTVFNRQSGVQYCGDCT